MADSPKSNLRSPSRHANHVIDAEEDIDVVSVDNDEVSPPPPPVKRAFDVKSLLEVQDGEEKPPPPAASLPSSDLFQNPLLASLYSRLFLPAAAATSTFGDRVSSQITRMENLVSGLSEGGETRQKDQKNAPSWGISFYVCVSATVMIHLLPAPTNEELLNKNLNAENSVPFFAFGKQSSTVDSA